MGSQAARQGSDIAVIGAGIIGLTTALRLSTAGNAVHVYSDLPIDRTASNSAGAIWGPFLSTVDSRGKAWGEETLQVLRRHAMRSDSGVSLVAGIGAEPATPSPGQDVWWVSLFTGAQPEHIPEATSYRAAWRYEVPIVDMPKYLVHLAERFTHQGGQLTERRVTDLSELVHEFDHVIVCAGLGSATLAQDDLLQASRGQLVVVQNPGITEFFCERGDGPDLTYILPQGRQLVLGGTAEWDNDSLEVDSATTESIVNRCAQVDARIAAARILGTRVGLRPCRSNIVCDHETGLAARHVIRNYGHGGSGLSLSWGCASEVVKLLRRCRGEL